MIKLEYVGNKPVITPNGVSFISSKHDKYNYIEPASHLLESLLNLKEKEDQEEFLSLSINPESIYNESKIFEILFKMRPDFENFFEEELQKYIQKIDEETEEVDQYKTLSGLEKETLLNNYKFMRKLRIQRATNKIVYENIINECVKIIYEKRVNEMSTPFSENFLHVCNSIGTSIEIAYKNAQSDVKVMLDQGQPYAKVFLKYV